MFNLFGAISFAPPIYDQVADAIGFAKTASPVGFWVLATWILIFGVGYVWLAMYSKSEPLFIAVAAACKMAIALFFFVFWFTGDLPSILLVAGFGDFIFALLFVVWLLQTRSEIQSA